MKTLDDVVNEVCMVASTLHIDDAKVQVKKIIKKYIKDALLKINDNVVQTWKDMTIY